MELTKVAAAARQIDTAIKLHFAAGDVCSVHTLASAAEIILRDLIGHYGGTSWYELGKQANSPIPPETYNYIFKKSQNFFKHADKDPEGVLDFQEFENDGMILFATIDYIELVKIRDRLPFEVSDSSAPSQLFQLWCFAARPEWGRLVPKLQGPAEAKFPGLSTKPRFQQLAEGGNALSKLLSSVDR